ncbi:MAG: hypothetical protein WCF53_01585, partial [Pseudolabrys sp.]
MSRAHRDEIGSRAGEVRLCWHVADWRHGTNVAGVGFLLLQPRFQPAIHLQRGGRESGDVERVAVNLVGRGTDDS